MTNPVFKNLDLKIDPANDDESYLVTVLSECGGDAGGTFRLSELTGVEDEHRSVDLTPQSSRSGVTLLNTIPPSLEKARRLGQRFFNAVFKNDVREAFYRCLATKESFESLRIRLNLTRVPNLATLPWEFLAEPNGKFFARSYNSIVRYLELTSAYDESLLTQPPLRILVVVSNPLGTPTLDNWRARELKECRQGSGG